MFKLNVGLCLSFIIPHTAIIIVICHLSRYLLDKFDINVKRMFMLKK